LAFPPEAMSHERIVRNVARIVGDGDRAERVVAGYRALEPDASDADLLVSISTDLVFRFPCEELLAAHAGASAGASTRSYLFTFESPAFEGRLRSTHALEIPFVFGVVDRPGNELFIGPIDDGVRALSEACASAWTSFAATGTPAGDGLPAWPAWDPTTRATMELGPERRIVDDPAAASRVLWVAPG
ncbi:MAG TPA: carboxylesterase family protein, partial [Acidimicrobiales bacterium]|nr:carboxylesterase family protein [Acidimicrobiales bacterium]